MQRQNWLERHRQQAGYQSREEVLQFLQQHRDQQGNISRDQLRGWERPLANARFKKTSLAPELYRLLAIAFLQIPKGEVEPRKQEIDHTAAELARSHQEQIDEFNRVNRDPDDIDVHAIELALVKLQQGCLFAAMCNELKTSEPADTAAALAGGINLADPDENFTFLRQLFAKVGQSIHDEPKELLAACEAFIRTLGAQCMSPSAGMLNDGVSGETGFASPVGARAEMDRSRGSKTTLVMPLDHKTLDQGSAMAVVRPGGGLEECEGEQDDEAVLQSCELIVKWLWALLRGNIDDIPDALQEPDAFARFCREDVTDWLEQVFYDEDCPFVLLLAPVPQRVIDKLGSLLSYPTSDGRSRLSVRVVSQDPELPTATRLGKAERVHGWVARWLWAIRERRRTHH